MSGVISGIITSSKTEVSLSLFDCLHIVMLGGRFTFHFERDIVRKVGLATIGGGWGEGRRVPILELIFPESLKVQRVVSFSRQQSIFLFRFLFVFLSVSRFQEAKPQARHTGPVVLADLRLGLRHRTRPTKYRLSQSSCQDFLLFLRPQLTSGQSIVFLSPAVRLPSLSPTTTNKWTKYHLSQSSSQTSFNFSAHN